MPAVVPLPAGTVTFLFTDIEGSTKLVERLGATGYARLLAAHQTIVRDAVAAADGHEVTTEGDSFFVVFDSAGAAVSAAVDAQRRLAAHPWPDGAEVRVRMGLHTGEGATLEGNDYVGLDVHRAARIAGVGHGGQILLSSTTRALVEGSLPGGVRLRDLGEHRLKDLSQRERIADLTIDGVPSEFPPLRTLDAVPNNLPTQLTSFLGREREIRAIEALLPTTRLLTLTGPGGTGKTRLSLQVAARVVDAYPDGVFFVPLASISDPELVPATIASVIGVADRGGRQPIERIVEHLGARRVFLVLDNFEQVTAAAPGIGRLLADARGTTVLVTSRSPLRLYGEHEYPVPPLSVPDVDHLPPLAALTQYEAVALFIARARAVRPDFTVSDENAPAVAEICYRLDGLPLALELAAARVRLLTPHAILARLGSRLDLLAGGARDLPDRQRTLRGAIAWSHDMLDGPQRALFADLAVFVRGAALDQLEPVVRPDVEGDVLDVLESLVSESLVRQTETADGEPRFWMLATITEFAAEQLTESGRRGAVQSRHAEQYLRLAQAARPHVMGPDKRRWLDRLDVEHDNVRAALLWSVAEGDAETAMTFLVALWRFWQFRGYLAEAVAHAREILSLPNCPDFADLRLDALEAAGGLAYWSGDAAASAAFYEEALAIQRQRGDEVGIANAAYNLSFPRLYAEEPDFDDAQALVEETLERFRRVGDRHGEGRGLWAAANVAYGMKVPERQRRYAEEALAIFRELDDRFLIGWTLYTIAIATFLLPEPSGADRADARVRLREALGIFAAVDDISGYTLVLDALAVLAWVDGDRERAARLSGVVATLERRSGTNLDPLNRELYGLTPEALRGAADTRGPFTEGEAMLLDEAVRYALSETSEPASSGARSS